MSRGSADGRSARTQKVIPFPLPKSVGEGESAQGREMRFFLGTMAGFTAKPRIYLIERPPKDRLATTIAPGSSIIPQAHYRCAVRRALPFGERCAPTPTPNNSRPAGTILSASARKPAFCFSAAAAEGIEFSGDHRNPGRFSILWRFSPLFYESRYRTHTSSCVVPPAQTECGGSVCPRAVISFGRS